MANNQRFADIVARKKPPVVSGKKAADVSLPIKGGRQTQPEGMTTLGGFLAELGSVQPDFNIQLLPALERLAINNSEISYAVENITTLGNTMNSFPSNIAFDDAVPDAVQKEMIARLKERSKAWYAYSGGMNSLVNDLLTQIAINGALSAERVPNKALDGIDKIVLVAPKSIRFSYDNQSSAYVPFQLPSTGMYAGGIDGIRLNLLTYSYKAYRKVGEKPYGIPPFIAALENIAISQDIGENLKHVVKKLGVLGFLEVLVNGPKPKQGEEDEAYYKRTEKYLQSVIPEVEKGVAKGYVVGFKGMHEFNMQPTTANVQGAKELIEVNDVKLMAGLKQDPMMFGRNFSTTETLARVILAKTTTQVTNYQKIVATFLEEVFLLDLQLAGYAVKNVEVEFDAPMIGDNQRDEDTRGKKIDNLDKLYKQGIISQQQKAQELGYDKADQEEPRAEPVDPNAIIDPNNPDEKSKKPKDGKEPTAEPKKKKKKVENSGLMQWQKVLVASFNPTSTGFYTADVYMADGSCNENVLLTKTMFLDDIDAYDVVSIVELDSFTIADLSSIYASELGASREEFLYSTEGCNCEDHEPVSFAKGSKEANMNNFIEQYLAATTAKYDAATKKTIAEIGKALAALPASATESMATDAVFYSLYKNWGKNFTKPQQAVINKFVKNIYSFFRKDVSIFNGADKSKIPASVFNQLDLRAIDFYKKSDSLYMGKFITDADMKKNLTSFIKENYLAGDLPLGDTAALTRLFESGMADVFEGNKWKLSRIIATTVNKMRNVAAVNYMNDADVQEFEIVGVVDRLQCGYCKELQGKKFSVTKAVDNAMQMVKSDPSMVGMASPFITAIYKKPSDIVGVSAEDLQLKGIGLPPYHANCRDQAVAIL